MKVLEIFSAIKDCMNEKPVAYSTSFLIFCLGIYVLAQAIYPFTVSY